MPLGAFILGWNGGARAELPFRSETTTYVVPATIENGTFVNEAGEECAAPPSGPPPEAGLDSPSPSTEPADDRLGRR